MFCILAHGRYHLDRSSTMHNLTKVWICGRLGLRGLRVVVQGLSSVSGLYRFQGFCRRRQKPFDNCCLLRRCRGGFLLRHHWSTAVTVTRVPWSWESELLNANNRERERSRFSISTKRVFQKVSLIHFMGNVSAWCAMAGEQLFAHPVRPLGIQSNTN